MLASAGFRLDPERKNNLVKVINTNVNKIDHGRWNHEKLSDLFDVIWDKINSINVPTVIAAIQKKAIFHAGVGLVKRKYPIINVMALTSNTFCR
jgi:hypothetical protein